ncbi:hypothetical protein LSH36_83g03012 [Paralvinella palmiformis]|uniref:Uncharacterized protein n=1 Tax=Paralvinella palmiformis TaxID=53620 RepID=A0AAD9K1W5_9ANNE|nr:hypothetical protein LSH36_83g03012 [Paralvinella palmiformis]
MSSLTKDELLLSSDSSSFLTSLSLTSIIGSVSHSDEVVASFCVRGNISSVNSTLLRLTRRARGRLRLLSALGSFLGSVLATVDPEEIRSPDKAAGSLSTILSVFH